MKLEFNDLAELDSFLSWANRYGTRRDTFTAGDGSAPDLEARDMRVGPYADGPLAQALDAHAFDTPPATNLTDKVWPAGDGITDDTAVVQPVTAEGKPARKRRTKAEIEAAAAAEARPEEAAALAAAVQQDKAAEGQTQPEGTNPFEQAAAPAADPAAPADDVPNAEPDVVTPFQHLTRGREFIAKHGMPKYLETFTKAGTDPNVMGYSAYQRGLHMAAMDELDKA